MYNYFNCIFSELIWAKAHWVRVNGNFFFRFPH